MLQSFAMLQIVSQPSAVGVRQNLRGGQCTNWSALKIVSVQVSKHAQQSVSHRYQLSCCSLLC